jgi:hypothetical protein
MIHKSSLLGAVLFAFCATHALAQSQRTDIHPDATEWDGKDGKLDLLEK